MKNRRSFVQALAENEAVATVEVKPQTGLPKSSLDFTSANVVTKNNISEHLKEPTILRPPKDQGRVTLKLYDDEPMFMADLAHATKLSKQDILRNYIKHLQEKHKSGIPLEKVI